jgi:DNA (cytosine-5)-methyltransferase 1
MEQFKPYSMKDLNSIKWNGLTVISTFSGCGGSSLGYALAGFKVLGALEFDDEAAATYRANFPGKPVVQEDVRKISGDELLNRIVGEEKAIDFELDLLDGSPPCAGFSTAGRRQKGWGEEREYSGQKQRVDDLFWEFARLVDQIRPKVFVGENVTGLAKGVSKGYFNEILQLFRSKGYVVKATIIDSSLLGVPQKRERVFFLGFRANLGIQPSYPRPLKGKPMTVRQALEGVPDGPEEETVSYIPKSMRELLPLLKPGQDGSSIKGPGSWFSLSRLRWDKPCRTVQASHGKAAGCACIHPEEDRRLTIPELRRVCAFPDDFVLTGPYHERWERLGRSVPPLVTKAIGLEIHRRLTT